MKPAKPAHKPTRDEMLEQANALPPGSPERQDALRALFSASKPPTDGRKAAKLLKMMEAAPLGSPQRKAIVKAMMDNVGTNEAIPGLDTDFIDHLDPQ